MQFPLQWAQQISGPTMTPGPDLQCMNKTLDFSSFYRGEQVRTSDEGWRLTTYRGEISFEILKNLAISENDDLDGSAIFDTSKPSSEDLDLGAPNESCEGGGPGIGEGGRVGTPGENCEPLGKVVVAHNGSLTELRSICAEKCEEDDSTDECIDACQPNDYRYGASFVLQFSGDVRSIEQVTLLDVGDDSGVRVKVGEKAAKYVKGNGNNGVTKIGVEDKPYEEGDLVFVQCLGSCGLVNVEYEECSMASPSPEEEVTSSPMASSDSVTTLPMTSPDSVADTLAALNTLLVSSSRKAIEEAVPQASK